MHVTTSQGITALMGAALTGHVPIVQYLAAERGVDVHASDSCGITALMAAAKNGHFSNGIQSTFTTSQFIRVLIMLHTKNHVRRSCGTTISFHYIPLHSCLNTHYIPLHSCLF